MHIGHAIHIGIVGTRSDSAVLVRALNAIGYQGPITIFSDRAQRPLAAKSASLQEQSVQRGVEQLKAAGATHLIVPPQFENGTESVLPVFAEYCEKFVVKYSLVGKLGVLGFSDTNTSIEDALKAIRAGSSEQSLSLRSTNVTQRELLGLGHSNRHHLIRHAVRTSLRPLRDAAVDTLLPTQRGQLFFQRIVTQQTSRKKVRFHGSDALEIVLKGLLAIEDDQKNDAYASLNIISTDSETDPLLVQARLKSVLSVGGLREVAITS